MDHLNNLWANFKGFAIRGNLIDMAVGIVVGGAFSTIAKSLVNDIIMPPVGLVLGNVDFQDLFWTLDDSGPYKSLELAQQAGAPTINYGLFINNILAFLIVAIAMFFIIRTVNRLKDMEEEEPSTPTKRNCPFCFSTISVRASRCPQCTSELEPVLSPGQLISLLGIGSIAIGFAFKDIAQNFLAGVLILLTQPFKVGDQIIKGDYEGTIEEIQTRATVLKTYDGRRVVIPNADLFTDSVTVNTAFDKRRSQYDVGIGYEDDIEKARQIMLDVLQNTEGILKSPAPDVLTVALDASSVNLRPRWWTKPERAEVVATENQVITGIKYALDKEGINIPFPIRTIFFHNETNGNNDPNASSNGACSESPTANQESAE